VNTAASAVVGLVVGLVLTFAVAEVARRREARRTPDVTRRSEAALDDA
jgi:hypothetical protein